MNNQREKLNELFIAITKIPNPPRCAACETPESERDCKKCVRERNVDYFIANGVTVKDRGHWVKIHNNELDGNYGCSVCNEVIDIADGRETPLDRGMNFCPNCGADLRGEE